MVGNTTPTRLCTGAMALALAAAFAFAPGCDSGEDYFHRLHGPTDVALIPPGGVFEVPVAYAPNFRNGHISKLDLKRIDLLVEDNAVAWQASPDLACGRDRVLDQIAVTTDGEMRIDVFVSDSQRDQVLRVPHARPDGDGGVEFVVASGAIPEAPVAQDGDGAALGGDAPTLDDLAIRPGYATTEDWTITYRGSAWVVEGTRSGLQQQQALPGLAYESDGEEIAFTMHHGGADVPEGTAFTFAVDTGIVEFELPGIAIDLQATPAGTLVLATVIDYLGDSGGLWIYLDDDQQGWLDLPAGAVPESMGFSRDGDAVFIADSSDANRVLKVTFDEGDPDSFEVTEIPVTEPNIDVAHSHDPDTDHLFVAAAYSETVEIIELTTGDPVDVNPWTEAVDPVFIGSLITGLDASAGTLGLNSITPQDRFEDKHVVVATTYAGYMHVMEADTGCQAAETSFGPYLEFADLGTAVSYVDVGPASDSRLLDDTITGEAVSINPCGGVARDQTWTLRFREDLLSWEVEGEFSGVQLGLAREDLRYVSDDGEISFVIASGARASSDGDWITFSVNDGFSPVGVLELPGDPVIFTDIYDAREGAWWEHREREIALVANAGNDVVMWIHIEGYGTGGLKYFR
jgi:hypothetical protein